jgi:hypothetical protein
VFESTGGSDEAPSEDNLDKDEAKNVVPTEKEVKALTGEDNLKHDLKKKNKKAKNANKQRFSSAERKNNTTPLEVKRDNQAKQLNKSNSMTKEEAKAKTKSSRFSQNSYRNPK